MNLKTLLKPEEGNAQMSFWQLTAEKAFQSTGITNKGIFSDEALKRLAQYGGNTLKGGPKASSLILFLLQFKSPITLLLIVAAVLSYFLRDTTDAEGFRTLGVAYSPSTSIQNFTRQDEKEMIFLGFVTLFGPPKFNVKETINELNELGVQLKIITGDNKLVAENLAKHLGMANPSILTGMDMRKMSESALIQKAARVDIFAEVDPNQKERIIHALHKGGNVVGFMGDGINDASASNDKTGFILPIPRIILWKK